MSKYPAIRNAIHNGEVDEFLEEIALAAAARRSLIRQMRANDLIADLQIGDAVMISSTCKPRLLAGAMVTYEGRDHSKYKVRLRQTYSAKWRAGSIIRIPATLIGSVIKERPHNDEG